MVVLLLFTILAMIILVRGVIRIVAFYLVLYEKCTNLQATYKISLVKVLITIFVMEKLIANFLYSFGADPFQGSSDYTSEEATLLGYGFLCMFELIAVIPLFFYAYTLKMDDSPIDSEYLAASPKGSFVGFVLKVLKLRDIIGIISETYSIARNG